MSKTHLTDACTGCPGRCCTRRFWGGIHLTKHESRNPIFKGRVGLNNEGEPMLVLGKRACHFLVAGRCSIYESRPGACRGFVCHSNDSRHVNDTIHTFPALRRHLKRHGVLPAAMSDTSFFFVKRAGSESVWHLRELRGCKAAIWRYSAKTGTSKQVGWFDRDEKFYRNHL